MKLAVAAGIERRDLAEADNLVSTPNNCEFLARWFEAGVLRSQSLPRERSRPAITNCTPYVCR